MSVEHGVNVPGHLARLGHHRGTGRHPIVGIRVSTHRAGHAGTTGRARLAPAMPYLGDPRVDQRSNARQNGLAAVADDPPATVFSGLAALGNG